MSATTRFDAPEFKPEKRDEDYCASCGNAMHKRNMGISAACGCLVPRYKKLLAEHRDLQARVLALEGIVAALDASRVLNDPEGVCV